MLQEALILSNGFDWRMLVVCRPSNSISRNARLKFLPFYVTDLFYQLGNRLTYKNDSHTRDLHVNLSELNGSAYCVGSARELDAWAAARCACARHTRGGGRSPPSTPPRPGPPPSVRGRTSFAGTRWR